MLARFLPATIVVDQDNSVIALRDQPTLAISDHCRAGLAISLMLGLLTAPSFAFEF